MRASALQWVKNHLTWRRWYAEHLWFDDRGWSVFESESRSEPWWIEDPPLRSPSDPDYLCEVCRHINFCWLFGNDVSEKKFYRYRQIRFGSVERVLKQENCSFCVLLAPSCLECRSEDKTVYLQSTCFSTNNFNHPKSKVKYLYISVPLPEVTIQVLDESRPMRGRQISPYIKQQQQNIAQQWLEKCEHEHFSGEDAPWVHSLALIDLKQRCIVRPTTPVRYAALSYVWGKTPQRMYSTSTQQEFESQGALHSKQDFLPQTITDAMDLAAHIGLDYLWVDSLCILQDDEANRNYLIGRMGSIYSTAAITIVDAHGDHAGSGLVGMSSARENRQRIATVQGMQLCTTATSLMDPWAKYHRCAWLQRGWTYQEMLLSKRLLLVTHQQLQFVCNHAVYFEETHPHSPRTSDWTMQTNVLVPIRRSAANKGTNLSLYCIATSMFTERVLTHDMDIIPAFDAIFTALYKNTEAKSLFNLPDVEIEEALLWTSGYPCDAFTPSFETNWSRMARRRHPDRLPTWSWAGWRGEIKYDWIRISRTPLISAVLWRCAPTSTVNMRSELALRDYRCAIRRENGWNYGFQSHCSRWVYTHDSRPNVFFQNPIPLKPHSGLHKPSFLDDSNVLQFSAFTVHISASTTMPGLLIDDRGMCSVINRRYILDSSLFLAGSICLDCLTDNEVGLRLVALARWSQESTWKWSQKLGIDLYNIDPLDWNPKYFRNIAQPNDVDKPKAKYGISESWDRRRFQNKFYPLYIALLVEVREGIAYRIGIGEVHIDAFHAANPTWEEVRLG